jgi:hypothetical protein
LRAAAITQQEDRAAHEADGTQRDAGNDQPQVIVGFAARQEQTARPSGTE